MEPGDIALLIRWDGPEPAPAWLLRAGTPDQPAGTGSTREAVDLKRLLKTLLRSHGFRAVAVRPYPAARPA